MRQPCLPSTSAESGTSNKAASSTLGPRGCPVNQPVRHNHMIVLLHSGRSGHQCLFGRPIECMYPPRSRLFGRENSRHKTQTFEHAHSRPQGSATNCPTALRSIGLALGSPDARLHLSTACQGSGCGALAAGRDFNSRLGGAGLSQSQNHR